MPYSVHYVKPNYHLRPDALGLPAAMELGRRLGMVLPEDEAITILAVEVEDVTSFGETCTPLVQAAIPRVAQMVVEEIL